MVNGVLYATAGTRRSVVAIDAATGELLWVHGEREGARGANAPRQLSGRGVGYWSDGKEERIIYFTPGYRMIALDAKTGQPIPSFGQNGVVDLKQDLDQNIDLVTGEIGIHSAPVDRRATSSSSAPRSAKAAPRRRTRTTRATFAGTTCARASVSGSSTPSRRPVSSATTRGSRTPGRKTATPACGHRSPWTSSSASCICPSKLPPSDYYGGHRPGNNLFAESLVCVDLKTGQRKWHYQLVHHPLWDMDISSAPILGDINVNGQTIKAVAQPTKQGLVYVFDRVTGKPVWPIDEKPVEKGTVPGEWYSPTQPFPSKPPVYSRNGVAIEDLIDFTPELRAEAVKKVAQVQDRPDLHAAGPERRRRSAGHAHARHGQRRHQLAWCFVRSGNTHRLCGGVQRVRRSRSDSFPRPDRSFPT